MLKKLDARAIEYLTTKLNPVLDNFRKLEEREGHSFRAHREIQSSSSNHNSLFIGSSRISPEEVLSLNLADLSKLLICHTPLYRAW